MSSLRGLAWGTLLVAAVVASGCGDDVSRRRGGDGDGGNGAEGGAGVGGNGGTTIPPAPPASQVDILLAVDNSRSMGDKQEVLALTVPDLVSRFVNPLPGEFAPIVDIHIGVVTSSLGSHGADACPQQTATGCSQGTNTTNDDRGHLIARADQCGGAEVPTYGGKGFLAWDPTGKQSPPGEADLGALSSALQDMVIGAGQIGCGYESQLESVYRFLADPAPYATITVQGNSAVKQGVDDVLLQQRRDFLRPASLLAVVMLSDENDCSTREYGQYFYANLIKNGDGTEFHLPKARSVCADNPADPCCKSCGQAADGCGDDPACSSSHDSLSDNINLRCFEQKRRFGIDFVYPTERYVNAFSLPAIDPMSDTLEGGGATVPNPIFTDLTGGGGIVRDPTLVFFTGIVGVPWQLIAKDPQNLAGGYKNAAELEPVWPQIVGDPTNYVPPSDPHMQESVDPRPGLPTSGVSDPFHGNEYDIPKRNDLQYACIFDVITPRDCTEPSFLQTGCDCETNAVGAGNPLCDPNPEDFGEPTLQTRAKAYPSLRQLAVIRDLGDQGVAASICAAELADTTSPAYGYRPAVVALIEACKHRLAD